MAKRNGRGSGEPGKRSCAQNYTDADVNAIMDQEERHETFGANMWAAVAHDYNKYDVVNERQKSDRELLGIILAGSTSQKEHK